MKFGTNRGLPEESTWLHLKLLLLDSVGPWIELWDLQIPDLGLGLYPWIWCPSRSWCASTQVV